MNLIDGGYNFVLLDGDVYLTGTRHPLSAMRPLEDTTWHIQFQSDRNDDQLSDINIGWYWARPTETVREFFRRSQEQWDETHAWDQWIMNNVRREMIYEGKLDFPKSIVLPLIDYKATMLFDWQPAFTNTDVMDAMNNEGVLIHYTWVWDNRKIFVAKHFGHWLNESYYIHPPLLLLPINVTGTRSQIFQQITRAANIAKLCRRTFMFPWLMNETLPEYNTWRMAPTHWIGEIGDIMRIGPWVESTFIRNRRRYISTNLTESTIPGPHDLADNWLAKPAVDACLESQAEIVNLDFSVTVV
jgi:hypothetical protein